MVAVVSSSVCSRVRFRDSGGVEVVELWVVMRDAVDVTIQPPSPLVSCFSSHCREFLNRVVGRGEFFFSVGLLVFGVRASLRHCFECLERGRFCECLERGLSVGPLQGSFESV